MPEAKRQEDEMYDLAKTIQKDRRRIACMERLASQVQKARSLTLGRYRITVERGPRELTKAA
jgi:hypothetical protein